jgi:signal transduction histidine kinase
MRRSAPLARAFGSVRVRITVLAMVVFAVAAIVGSMVLVGSVRGALEDGVRKENAVALAGLAAQVRGASDGTGAGVAHGDVLVPSPGALMFRVSNDAGEVVAGTPSFVTGYDGSVLISTQEVPTRTGKFTIAVASPLDGVRRAVDTVERFLILGIVVLVGLVGAAVWFIVRRALRPVEEMCSEVEEITHGTLHRRVPVPETHDEIAHLAATMNEMLDRLEGAAARQREFVSDASHELRSPLTAMRTALEVTRHGDAPIDWDAVRDELLDGNRRMEALVDGLLQLARADDATPALPDPPVEIAEVVADEVARARRLPVRLGDVNDVLVLGRADQLGRVVRNLVDNAERYAHSRVEVSVRSDGNGTVVLAVDDDGPGIPIQDRVRVFARFTRLGEDRSRDDGGAGLGLAIVQSIVDRSGGSVAIVDSALGGARVEVRLVAAPRVRSQVSAGVR